jgi:hypothetical protein
MRDRQQLVSAFKLLKDQSSEVSIMRYHSESGPFIKVVGCNSNGGLIAHMEMSETEYRICRE